MNEIAHDMGISKAALYYSFHDKNELFRAVVSREQKEFLALLRKNSWQHFMSAWRILGK